MVYVIQLITQFHFTKKALRVYKNLEENLHYNTTVFIFNS